MRFYDAVKTWFHDAIFPRYLRAHHETSAPGLESLSVVLFLPALLWCFLKNREQQPVNTLSLKAREFMQLWANHRKPLKNICLVLASDAWPILKAKDTRQRCTHPHIRMPIKKCSTHTISCNTLMRCTHTPRNQNPQNSWATQSATSESSVSTRTRLFQIRGEDYRKTAKHSNRDLHHWCVKARCSKT